MQTHLFLIDLSRYREIEAEATLYRTSGQTGRIEVLMRRAVASQEGASDLDLTLNREELPRLITELKKAATDAHRSEVIRIVCGGLCRAFCRVKPVEETSCDLTRHGLLAFIVEHSDWLSEGFAGVSDWASQHLAYGLGMTDEVLSDSAVNRFEQELNQSPKPDDKQLAGDLDRCKAVLRRAVAEQPIGNRVDLVTF